MIGFWLVLLLAIAALVTVIVLSVVARTKRATRMEKYAQANGWLFQRSTNWHRHYKHFEPFGRGSSRKCYHAVEGERNGSPFRAFQYEYTIQSGKNSTRYYHTIVVLATPVQAPALSIRPEHFGHKVLDALGGEDIDFESDAFSRKFWVKCSKRRFAYDVISPRAMEWFLRHGRIDVQWQGERMVIRYDARIEPETVEGALKFAHGWFALLPKHVLASA